MIYRTTMYSAKVFNEAKSFPALAPSARNPVQRGNYRGTSLIRNRDPPGPYTRTMPMALGGGAFSYERGTPVQLIVWRIQLIIRYSTNGCKEVSKATPLLGR